MELAGYNSVAPLGMAGTGDAEILPDSGANPLQMADAYAGRNRQAKMAQQQAVGQLGNMPLKYWDRDSQIISGQLNALEQRTAEYLKRNNGRVNVLDDEWRNIQNAGRVAQQTALYSAQEKVRNDDLWKDYISNPNKYDDAQIKQILQAHASANPWERVDMPLLPKLRQKPADLEKGINESFGKLHQNERQTVRPDIGNGGYKTTESKSYSPTSLTQGADDLYYSGRDGEASYREAADAIVKTLPQEHQDRIARLAKEQNIPLGQAYLRESFNNRATTTNKQSINEFNSNGKFGFGNDKSGAETIINVMKGLADPNSAAWTNQNTPLDVDKWTQSSIEGGPDQVLNNRVSTSLQGLKLKTVPVLDEDGNPKLDPSGKPVLATGRIDTVTREGNTIKVHMTDGTVLPYPVNRLSNLVQDLTGSEGYTSEFKNEVTKLIKKNHLNEDGTETWVPAHVQIQSMSNEELAAQIKAEYPNASNEERLTIFKKLRSK